MKAPVLREEGMPPGAQFVTQGSLLGQVTPADTAQAQS